MAQLKLALLGPLRVTLDEQPVTSFAYDKVRALLAYLAVESHRPHTRDALGTLLWPDEPAGVARKNLRTALATLRQAIGDAGASPPFLLISRDTLQLNPAADHHLDVASFASLLAEADRHAHPEDVLCDSCAVQLAQAAELYRGDFAEGLDIRHSAAWEEWTLLMRERLHGQMLDALAQLMTYHEVRGEDEQARRYAWRTLALEAWDESAHRCLMRAYARAGQRAAALAQYERCRKLLADELGVDPAAETTGLYERIRSGPLERVVGAAVALPEDEQPPALLPEADSMPEGGSIAETQLQAEPIAREDSAAETPDEQPGGTEAVLEHLKQPVVRSVLSRNRQRILDKVRRFWIAGVLEQSIASAIQIELGLAYRPEAVERPYDMLVKLPDAAPRTIPAGTQMIELYDELDGEMLILGAPGSGKTTTLLELARALLDRAEQDAALPLPVVFNLSSWAAQRRPLAEWLVDELNLRYQVPRAIGRAWVATGQVLPLLDGLDEVAPQQRTACVKAINLFHEQHWLLPLVVCSRSADYDLLATKLRLHRAVVVQPLHTAQVDSYLARGGAQLAAVRALLAEDAALRELADTPLMLGIMSLAYRGKTPGYAGTGASLDERRRHLFDTYIRQAFERRAASRYAPQQTMRWLAWLARAMAERSQSIFFVEGLQPNLLSANARRWYAAGVGLGVGLVASLFAVLANLFSLRVRFGPEVTREWLGILLLGATVAPVAGAVLGMAMGSPKRGQIGLEKRWRLVARHTAWLAPTLALAYGLTGGAAVGFAQSLGIWPALTVVSLIATSLTQPGTIVAVERYHWSWAQVRARLPLIGGFALLGGGLYQMASTPLYSLLFVLASLVVLGVVLGLSASEIEARTWPNQGIWRSASSAAETSALFGSVGLLSVATLFSWFTGPVEGIVQGVGAATVAALLGWLVFGGLACLQHLVLRLLLWRDGAMPWNYARFLDGAADLMLLRKVGGGYIFMHRLLLEHFAELDTAAAPAPLERRSSMYPRSHAKLREDFGNETVHSRPLATLRGSDIPRDETERASSSPDPKSIVQNLQISIPPTPLIGRNAEVAAAANRLHVEGVRLLTLVGPPGVGKTRLGLAVAAALHSHFATVAFVPLVPLRDPARVADAIAAPLHVAERGDRPLVELLISYLRDRHTLLMLDNFEHLLDAAPLVAELLAACPGLTILATSRAPLHVRAERLFAIAPLAVPDLAEGADTATIAQSPAVALFVERVQAARPDFALNNDNAAPVAAICERLEGLPLAIELAAAHITTLGAEALLAQLDRRLAVLVDGPRDLPRHQQGLRTALGWSYDLLATREQLVFAALGVCLGGCDLDALGALCPVETAEDLRRIARALVNQHLVQLAITSEGDERLSMLETVREYALERLRESGVLQRQREHHARHFLALAERAHPALHGPQVLAWLARLEREHDNLRAAIGWCGEAAERAHLGLQLAGALWPYWQLHGHFAEGRAWFVAFLAPAVPTATPEIEARARLGAAWLAYSQDDYAAATAHGQASLKLFQRNRDRAGQADALNLVGFCVSANGDYVGGVACLTESVALARVAGVPYTLAFALLNLGFLHADQEHTDQAREHFEESLVLSRHIHHPVLVTRALNGLGELARLQGDYQRAEAFYSQSLQLYETLADRRGSAALQHNLGCVALFYGDAAGARARFLSSLAGYGELGDSSGMAAALAGLAGVLGLQGHTEQAARLFGAAFEAREAMRVPMIVPDLHDYQRSLDTIHAQIGAAAFETAWAQGRMLPLEQALAEATGQAQLELAR